MFTMIRLAKKKNELGNELFENEVENLVQIFFLD